jgi:hypothetical protein
MGDDRSVRLIRGLSTVDSLRVPKRRASVEALLLDGTFGRFELFLAETSPRHEGPERLVDLLSQRDRFLPALEAEKEAMTWVNTSNVVFARASLETDPQPELETLPTEHEIEIVLRTGTRLKGLVSYIRPDGHSRATDFLNDETEPFLRLLESDAVVFVNKRHVVRVLSGGW